MDSPIDWPLPDTSMERGIRAEIKSPMSVHPSLPLTILDLWW